MVSTLRCGRSNPGSNPGYGRNFLVFILAIIIFCEKNVHAKENTMAWKLNYKFVEILPSTSSWPVVSPSHIFPKGSPWKKTTPLIIMHSVQLNKFKTDPYFLQNFHCTTMFISKFCKICELNTELEIVFVLISLDSQGDITQV